MKLGIIVLPSSNEELQEVLAKLAAGNVASIMVNNTTGKQDPEPEPELETSAEELKVPTGPELQAILTRVRDEQGADTLTEILTSFGATKLKELQKSDWPAIYRAAEVALGEVDESNDDLLDDDGLGLDDPDDLLGGEELDPEDVKTACQEHAKKHGKAKTEAILAKNGLNTVRGLKSASQDVLAAIMKAVK